MSLTRRDFLGAGAVTAAGLALGQPLGAAPAHDPVGAAYAARPAAGPVAIASANGLRGVARAHELMRTGADPLDAIIAGVNIQELDPEDQSVGLGGLPNEDGVVQLDASCMHGPTRRAGAVACLEGIATPSLVAKAVMDYTDHVMLVGPDAKRFALDLGFTEQNLLTEKSREMWLRWRATRGPDDAWLEFDHARVTGTTGTVHMSAVDADGSIASVTSTSGMSWKIPGRVGDSPIIGAGQYCDDGVGAAGSTGRGESNIKACGAFLVVELMRQGLEPEEACLRTLQRVLETTESRLLDERGRPRFDLDYYAVRKDGRVGAAAMYEGSRFAVCDARGARLEASAYLFRASERPRGPIPGTVPRR